MVCGSRGGQGCASALFELCSRAPAGLPVSVACLLLLGGFEDMTLALLCGWAGAREVQ